MVAGVCGGLAQYMALDPTIVRLIFLLLALAGGPGLLIYLIMWIITPVEP
jgi:phage shock protein C